MIEGISEIFQIVYTITAIYILAPLFIIGVFTLYISSENCAYESYIVDLSVYLKICGSFLMIFLIVCVIFYIIMFKYKNTRFITGIFGILSSFVVYGITNLIMMIIGIIEVIYSYDSCYEKSCTLMIIVFVNIIEQGTFVLLVIINLSRVFCETCC
jgi:hypothetical protein